ncbi:MAG: DUF3106 domain-containing protein [Opitutae bacterium]|nr:DUF3106 domain-containing protein [Opitutae bacterium]
MKTAARFSLFAAAGLAVLLITPPLWAADPPAPPPVAGKDLSAVEQFLNLSDAELEQMARVLERLRAMSPAERAALRAEIAKFRQLPEPQRQALRQGWGWMPREIQDGWREMMQGATPARRTEIQTKMQALSADERTAYRRQLVEEYLRNQKAGKP